MTDYTKSSGTGTMMIRDTGITVELWFKAGDSTSTFYGLYFDWTVNGDTYPTAISYPAGGDWYHIGSIDVYTPQTITFRLVTATTIPGIGGPTTLSAVLVRDSLPSARPPDAPSQPWLSYITVRSIDVSWTPNGSGSDSVISGYQVGWGTNSAGPTFYMDATSPVTVPNLAMGTTYFFWARASNTVGWSDWSPSAYARTYLGVYINYGGVWKLALPYIRDAGVWKRAEPVVKHS